MPTSETTATYGALSIGGATARQITGYTIEHTGFEASAFECSFITTASTDASFKSEIQAVRDAFRIPRQDFTFVQNGQTIISWKHSDNTGFDANPMILKDGDPADTGRSRHYRVRIEFGLPADNVSSGFRRHSTITVVIDPSKIRTVTIAGVYTANSTNGTTGSYAQYLAEILDYASSVTTGIDSSAKWDLIGQPQIERNETDKVTSFSIVFREIIHNQKVGTLDDLDIIDPVMNIVRERWAPGDSTAGGFTFGAAGGLAPVITSGTVNTVALGPSAPPGNPGQDAAVERPMRIIISYSCSIDQTRTKDIKGKWKNTIRPFLIAEAGRVAERGVTLIKEDPGMLDYGNRIEATMEFLAYMSDLFEQTITVRDRTGFGYSLAPLSTKDPYDYYEFPGPSLRQRSVSITYKKLVGDAKPESVLDGLVVEAASSVNGLAPASGWMPVSNDVAVANFVQGTDGPKTYANVTVERVAQRRNKRQASVANAGGVTGAGLT